MIGPYNIIRLIGSGGMGSVYEAFNPQIERRAAIKTLSKEFQQDAEFIQRFFNEARAVNIINHPSVVTVYDFGTADDGSPYIVMEYLQGETLRQQMNKSGRMDPVRAMKTFRQIASGLAAAHAKKIVHRDLKPGNILIVTDPDGPDGERAKILDFGIAKLAADPSAKALTRMGVSMGTPAYMSPELCRDAREVTDRSDVYSLGVMLFESLSGEHPFASSLKADSAMMASHIGQPPPALESKVPGLSAELLGLVNRMLAKQPDARPSAAEVAASLGRLTGSVTGVLPILDPSTIAQALGTGANPVVPAPQADVGLSMVVRPLQENRGLALGAAALLLLGIVGVVVVVRLLLTGPPSAPPQVRWTIESDPTGAEVLDATGQSLGRTPLSLVRVLASAVDVLSVRKDGYAEVRIPCDRSKDILQKVTLVKAKTDAAAVEEGEKSDASSDEKTTRRQKSKSKSSSRSSEKRSKERKSGSRKSKHDS